MKISNNTKNFKVSNKGLLNNKTVLKGLETISEHGTSFVALTTLLMASGVRPLVINSTPNVKKENKEYASINSIASGLVKFSLVEAIAIPIENAVKNIDKNPEKFLNSQTIKNLKGNANSLLESQNYKFITQVIKMGTGLVTAIPKAMITVALIPPLMELFFKKNKQNKQKKLLNNAPSPIFAEFYANNSPSFKGRITNMTAKGIGKILNNQDIQNFAKKYSNKNTDIARNVSMLTDILLTGAFIHQTKKNKKIKDERKTALITNNIISTAISLVGGYTIDNLVKKGTQKFIKKFCEINKNDAKLNKYIEGINILRPTLIFAGIYYCILPIFTTYISDKIDNLINSNNKAN